VADAFRILADSDRDAVGCLAALRVRKLGPRARDTHRDLGISAAKGAEVDEIEAP
jgi:hypothetical protein